MTTATVNVVPSLIKIAQKTHCCILPICVIVLPLLFFVSTVSAKGGGTDKKIPYGKQRPELFKTAYHAGEKFTYDISWTGGIKIGELNIEIEKTNERKNGLEIRVLATTKDSIFEYIYPVKDKHVTKVSGKRRLPFHYEVWQKEGWNYEAHRVTRYRQRIKQVWYRHNENPLVVYHVDGLVHNEFSSFLATRVMDLQLNRPFIVPTFADHRRNEVAVEVMRKTRLEKTAIGTVDTIEVMPIMKFEGLYDKRGDTVIWFTDDECRIPVKINSKIILGSLTSELVAWESPGCSRYKKVERKKVKKMGKDS